jgi:hydrogenase maturation protease
MMISNSFLEHRKGKTLVLGLGNTILTDDGIGIYAVRALQAKCNDPRIVIEEAGLGGLELLDPLCGYERVIIVDAMKFDDLPPGEVVRLKAEDLKGGSAMSRHQVPFHEALEVGRRLGMDIPDSIIILGIQAENTMTFGETCTPRLAERLPEIVDVIIKNIFASGYENM